MIIVLVKVKVQRKTLCLLPCEDTAGSCHWELKLALVRLPHIDVISVLIINTYAPTTYRCY